MEESIEYLVLGITYRGVNRLYGTRFFDRQLRLDQMENTRYLKLSCLSPVIRILDDVIFNFLNGTQAATRAIDRIANISDTTIRSSIGENYDRNEESKEIDIA